MIEAKVLAHSACKHGVELVTVQTKAPKFLDAEIEKHRMISTNSSSDRAIPVRKMIDRPMFIPDDIRKNQPGMQGYDNLSEEELKDYQVGLAELIEEVKEFNTKWADIVHKQTLNRNLLGWSMQDKVMTATREEWDYFFGLRCDEMADPSIQILANSIKDAIDNSIDIDFLMPGEWHLPYISNLELKNYPLDKLKMASVARCARVSYLNHDKSDPDLEKDIKLFKILKDSRHWSCFEHIATPMREDTAVDTNYWENWELGVSHCNRNDALYSGNFKSWIQYRKLLDS